MLHARASLPIFKGDEPVIRIWVEFQLPQVKHFCLIYHFSYIRIPVGGFWPISVKTMVLKPKMGGGFA